MAKRKTNKSQAVRDYASAHPKATSGEIAAALAKQGIKITAAYVANIKSGMKKTRKAAKTPAPQPAPVATERPLANGDTVSVAQIKTLAETAKAMGGFGRVSELLSLIQEVGGVRKFKNLVEVLAGA